MIPLDKQLAIVQYASENPSKPHREIAEHFGVGQASVSRLVKRREQVLQDSFLGMQWGLTSDSTQGF